MSNSKLNSTIYHRSNCITCKTAISEIDRMKIDIQKRDFFKDPFSEVEFLRKRDKIYKELDLGNSKKTNSEIIKLMVKNPGLIKRPIILKKNQVFVGKMDINKIK